MIELREICLIFTASTILFLGIYVISANPRRDVNRVFGLFCVFAFVWITGILLVRLSPSKEQAMLWGRVAFFGCPLAAGFFLYFSLIFPERTIQKRVSNPYFLLIPGVAFALLAFTGLILKDVEPTPWGYDSVHGSLYGPFIIYVFFYTVLGILHLFTKFINTSSPIRKLQLKYVLLGLTVAPVIALITNALLPALWSSRFTDVGPTSFIVLVVSTSYAIVRHRLMDIDFLIKKGSILLFFLMILCFPAFILLLLLEDIFYQGINYEFTIVAIGLMVLFSLTFLKIKTLAEEKIEKFIFKDRYRSHRTLMDFSRALVSILDLTSLSKRVIDTVSEAMEVTSGSLYILEEQRSSYELYEQRGLGPEVEIIKRIPQNDPLFRWLLDQSTVAVKDELTLMARKTERDTILGRMNEMESEVCVPLVSRKRLIGVINLGKKRNNGPFTIQDIELLTTLGNQTAIAIENAKLYEDMKKQKAIMRRADRLASLGTLTAGLAHEIRNPLVAIKTLTQLLPERIDDEEFRKDFLAIASGEVDRISSLVNELLEFARPTKPQLQYENLSEIMDGMVLLISTEVKKQNLEITSEYGENIPPVPIDREQIKQVFLNILLNAIEATDEGGMVGVEIRTFATEKGERFVQVEIRDTGRGIPEEHLDNIFTPFFTTKKKGSGLGLSNAHQIIQEHGGTITVESRVGKGSSFCINLPVSPEVREDKVSADKESHVSHPPH